MAAYANLNVNELSPDSGHGLLIAASPLAGSTALVVNADAGLASGKLLDLQVLGVSKASINSAGVITGTLSGNASTATAAAALNPVLATNTVAGSSGTANGAAGTVKLASGDAVYTLTNSSIVAGTFVLAAMQTAESTDSAVKSIVCDTSAHTAVITLNHTVSQDSILGFLVV